MPEVTQVSRPPDKPLLAYDGECKFCCFWIYRWKQITGEQLDYAPYQDPSIEMRFPEIPRQQFETAVQLIGLSGKVQSGAEAVFRSLALNPAWQWPLHLYQSVPGAAWVTDRGYRFVARHRMLFSVLTRTFWGQNPEIPRYELVRWLFLRGLGLIYLVAFISLWSQIHGLIGRNGILPARPYVEAVEQYFDQAHLSLSRYWLFPTWGWISASDRSLDWLCGSGTVLAVLFFAGYAPTLCAVGLWSLYLSLAILGREFLAFQWDVLLLEVGFLAIFFSPLEWIPGRERGPPVSKIALGLLRWLLFRLMFESGCVKLLSGDLAWRSLNALHFHYETQPLPTWIGWWAHQAPNRFQQACVGVLFGVELALPFFIFGPKRLRVAAAGGFAILQVWILLTGNYGFFNYLTLALTLLLVDDAVVEAFLPFTKRWSITERIPANPARPVGPPSFQAISGTDRPSRVKSFWPRWITVPLALTIMIVSVSQILDVFHANPRWLEPARLLGQWVAPLRSINSYGLFAVMTKERPEILIQGSNDGENWRPYEFKYKPGLLARKLKFVAPHQPRLDWQMWFAALGNYRENPWLIHFCFQLLRASPEVEQLLWTNPFPDHPPRYVRAELWDYHFTTWREWKKTGEWWKRARKGEYLPALSLADFSTESASRTPAP